MARVLVVDDDHDVLTLVLERIRRGGHKVVGASSGPEALRMVEERGSPDIAVLDVSMPEMDGLDLCDRLRGLPGGAELPVIFLSARCQESDVAAGRAKGATYLTKPFVSSALLSAIDRAVAASRERSVPDDAW